MTTKGITFAQVSDAANAIKARGHEPTGYAVRNELGGTGSFTTIQSHLVKWKQETAETVQSRDLPQEVENAMHQAIAICWTQATKIADETTAAVRQTCDDQLKAKDAELVDAAALIRELEQEVSNAEALRYKAQTEAETHRHELDQAKGAYAELKARFDDLVGLKQRAAGAAPAADTKPERPRATKPASGSKPAASTAAQ